VLAKDFDMDLGYYESEPGDPDGPIHLLLGFLIEVSSVVVAEYLGWADPAPDAEPLDANDAIDWLLVVCLGFS